MYFEATSFQELIEIMVSCDRLGLMYVVQKDFQEFEKWFGIRREIRPLWKLQVVQYVEEVEENEGEEISHRRQSESEEERTDN